MATKTPIELKSSRDSALARDSGERLARAVASAPDAAVTISVGASAEPISLPHSAAKLLIEGLAELGRGNEIRLLPIRAELTTQEASELLNLSRPYVVRLLDGGKIPSYKVGTHRRVRLDDVLAYKRELDADRLDALMKLVVEAQELEMGY
jgi:excisionase family DNA binding protein